MRPGKFRRPTVGDKGDRTMNMTGNTILITGGGSGIGRGLAEAFHGLGNQVVIAGRRKNVLDETTTANPGMKSAVLDIEHPGTIKAFGAKIAADFPKLNVVIHNAAIMRVEHLTGGQENLDDAGAMITTNLLGPIRLTAALLPLLQKQPKSTVMTVSSGLAFLPLAMSPTYSATKAAFHSWTESLRYQLKKTTTEVIELIPPYVQTELGGDRQKTDPRAMPLPDFIAEVMQILTANPTATEINVERVKPLRFAEQSGNYEAAFNGLNDAFAAGH
jgi:uncharacterized oxidoreductase